MVTNISILGSTGSIGTQTINVLSAHRKYFKPIGLSAGSNVDLLKKQILEFSPKAVSVASEENAQFLKKTMNGRSVDILWGEEGNIKIATLPDVDKVVIATLGLPGIRPTLAAIDVGKTVALATKEVLVAAGQVITKAARINGVQILPIDSEHSAIFQCIQGRSKEEINKIFLTCSGGPFRGMRASQLKKVKLGQALKHPNWKMGQKITIDSATLMNKGFEAIEASWLFGVPLGKIKVIVHPQSVIHSAVEFTDGSIIAQIGPPDMRLPIQYALFYPQKAEKNHFSSFSFDQYPNLSFETPDTKTFRCLKLAYEAMESGGTYPAVLNGANDVAVGAFLQDRIAFVDIPVFVEKTLEKHKVNLNPTIEDIFEADQWARGFASSLVNS